MFGPHSPVHYFLCDVVLPDRLERLAWLATFMLADEGLSEVTCRHLKWIIDFLALTRRDASLQNWQDEPMITI